MNPMISVIVPVYKVEKYLPRCMDSILNQTYRNLEIILVDDGSPDNCGAICDQYAQQDARIRVIHQENRGVSAARNAGLDSMRGEYLTFVDPDDWLAPDMIEHLYNRILQDNSDMAIGQMIKVFEDGHTQPSYCAWMRDMKITGQEALAMLGTETSIPCYAWGSLIKPTVYKELRFAKLHRGEDVWMIPHVLSNCRSLSLDSRVLYYYYQRTTSAVHTPTDAQWLDSAVAEFHVTKFLLKRGLWKNASVYYAHGVLQLLNVKDIKKSRQLARESFSWNEWLHLIWCRPRCVVHRAALRFPKLYLSVRNVWRKIRYKER